MNSNEELIVLWAAVIILAVILAATNFVWIWLFQRNWKQSLDRVVEASNTMRQQEKDVSPEPVKSDTVIEQSADETRQEVAPAPAAKTVPSTADELTADAYASYYSLYRQIADGLTIDNFATEGQRLMELIVEMGLWTKDYLPLAMNDINVSQDQVCNARQVSNMAKGQGGQQLQSLPLSDENPFHTPVEVIALVRQFRQMGIRHLGVSISGFQYKYEQ